MGAGALPAGALSERASEDLAALTAAVERGSGFPTLTRAASRVLGASLAVVDRSSAVLAIAARSPEEEGRLRSRGAGVKRRRLRVDEDDVGELRLRPHDGVEVDESLAGLVAAVLALELARTRSSDWADEEAATALVDTILERTLTSADEITQRTKELGLDLDEGGGVVMARAEVGAEADEDWPARVLTAATRGVRAGGRGSLISLGEFERFCELRAIVPCPDTDELARAAESMVREVAGSVPEASLTTGHSRHTDRPEHLYRAGREALLAVNVAEAEEVPSLAFESTGSYRLLLSTMSENPAELEWFYNDTVAPLAAYDVQYGTDLLTTVEAFLKNDGNIGPTAEELFAHRHTVRYRLGRVRDLCGYDIQSTDGRERLGFGLKVMRVLGIGPRRERRPGADDEA